MDRAHGVAFDSARNIAFVVGLSSDSLAVVDVSTPANPMLLGGVKDSMLSATSEQRIYIKAIEVVCIG